MTIQVPADANQGTAGSVRESTRNIASALAKLYQPVRTSPILVAFAVSLYLALAAIILWVPDTDRFWVEGNLAAATIALLVAALLSLTFLVSRTRTRTAARSAATLAHWTPWLTFAGVWLLIWEWATAKTGWLAPPYFTPPQQLLAEAYKDRVLLAQSFGNSLTLLSIGFLIGVLAGLSTGLIMGWSKTANYWVHPILQYIGPVPTLAWVPIIFVIFPTAYSGAVFLIALSVWFPVTVLTRAGVMSVPRSYYDVAQTLGASQRFLIFRISLPAALPSIFTGLFMALGISFVTLTIAENFGVNSGLGWYINWKKGWSAYPAMYAAIVAMVLFCGGLLTLLLAIRRRVLSWQKDLVRW